MKFTNNLLFSLFVLLIFPAFSKADTTKFSCFYKTVSKHEAFSETLSKVFTQNCNMDSPFQYNSLKASADDNFSTVPVITCCHKKHSP